jgi:hypothetical protein
LTDGYYFSIALPVSDRQKHNYFISFTALHKGNAFALWRGEKSIGRSRSGAGNPCRKVLKVNL